MRKVSRIFLNFCGDHVPLSCRHWSLKTPFESISRMAAEVCGMSPQKFQNNLTSFVLSIHEILGIPVTNFIFSNSILSYFWTRISFQNNLNFQKESNLWEEKLGCGWTWKTVGRSTHQPSSTFFPELTFLHSLRFKATLRPSLLLNFDTFNY